MKIGIVGGIGPESTIDYYKSIIAAYQKIKPDGSYPQISIESIDMQAMLALIDNQEWDSLVSMLVHTLNNLSYAGAELAVIASNTPHAVFDKVKAISPLPLLSIVEATCNKANELKLKKVGLLGTAFTMREDFYKNCFFKKGIHMIVPNKHEQEYIQEKIFSELEMGITKETTKKELLAIINRMTNEECIDGLVLGCTELPLILKDGDCNIPFLNTVEIHVASVINEIRKNL